MMLLALALPVHFAEPQWLWLALLVPVLVLASLRSLAGLEPARRAIALVVRCFVVIVLIAALAGIEYVRRTHDLTVIYLMDRSHSVEALERQEEDFIVNSTEDIPKDDRVGMIDFAGQAFLQQLPMRGGYFIGEGRLPEMPNNDRTDMGAALRLAMAMFPHDTARRIVLLSDGNDNMGDVIGEARRAGASGIPIDVVPLRYERPNEVYFERLLAPTFAEPGEQVELRMLLGSSKKAVSGTLSVYVNGELLELPPDASRVNIKPGRELFVLKLPVQSESTQSYEVVFRPDDDSLDGVAMNNSARAFTFVSGKSRLLVVSMNPQYDQPLVDALRSEHVLVDVKTPEELGEFLLPDMMSYSAILLANVPATVFTDDQQQALASYVKDMGSGLIMTGGDEGFGAGGWLGSPVEEVMPVQFEIKHKKVIPRGALVLIMHSCEAARGNYWGKEMAKKSVDTVSTQDYVGVLAYTYSPGGENWEVPLDLNTNRAAVKARIDRMQIGDMPDFNTTMRLAYDELTKGRGQDAAQKHVIIFSDGDPQAPTPQLLSQYVEAKITVSTIGIGWGAHVMQTTMRQIATATGGNFYAPRDPRQLPQIFTKESKVVRRPLIVEDPFSPQVLQPESALLAGLSPGNFIPQLDGLVLTSRRENPNVFVPLVKSTEDGFDPLLAHWQYELGKTAAFTSGYWPKWGTAWTQWSKFAKLWSQIVRWTMRQDTPANFDTYTRIEGDRAHIVIDALDKDAGYLNNLTLRSRLVGPDNRPLDIRFTQTGPGKYEAEFDAARAGQYLANVQLYEGNTPLGTVRTGVSVPFSPEYRDLATNESVLRQVAEITGGRWLDMPGREANIFAKDRPSTEARRPAWEWVLAWLLLPAFLLDVAVRRLANWLALSIVVEIVVLVVLLYGVGLAYGTLWGILGAILLAELIGWTIRFRYIPVLFDILTHGTAALEKAGERGAAALEQLRETRERIRQEKERQLGDAPKRIAQPMEDATDRAARRRYDVGDAGAKKPAGDLSKSLGGAEGESSGDKSEKDAPKGAEETSTSRLLRAKRRARGDTDKKE
ncbi:MAG: VWA domain-containing protein [Phycisphaerae bacterium]|nr:VWA domain-containing protein [Phycisphaerae bacterium]